MKTSIPAIAAFICTTLPFLTPVSAAEKPVKVYILAGQSNMVGMGMVTGLSTRWSTAKGFHDAVLSIYEGSYDPKADYDKLTPLKTLPVETIGGEKAPSYPKEGVQVVRGVIQFKTGGEYSFNAGYKDSSYCSMEVNGVEVHRREIGGNAVSKSIKLAANEKVPFKITHFNQSGRPMGWFSRKDTPGTLSTLVKIQGKYPQLLDKDGNWASRNDVWYKGVVTATANKWLSIGCGATAETVGPELGFGWVLGDFHDEPVLIIKASQGNRSLAWDFLPPGSERFEADGKVFAGYKDPKAFWPAGTEPEPGTYHAGKQYDQCFSAVKNVLENFDESFPHWKGRGYQIAGFAWHQGHKDTGSGTHAKRYEYNLVNLIKALRKDFNAPNAPFVVSTGCGNNGREGTGLTIAEAQLAVDGDTGKYPEFKGNVKSVDVRDTYPTVEESPKPEGYHYHRNAGTYLQIGEAMGKAMLELLKP